MKPNLLMLGALITSVVIVGCGPAVGRAVGDTETTNGTNATAVDANVDKQLGDFKKEQDEQRQELTKDFRSEVKQTQVLFSQQEEEFYTLKNAIDELETELAVVKDSSHMAAPDQPDMVDMADFKEQVQQNEDFDMELKRLHSRIDSLEETADSLRLILGDFDQRAGKIEGSLDYLGSTLEDSQPDIEAHIEELRSGFEQQLELVVERTNSLEVLIDQNSSDTDQSIAHLSDEIANMGGPKYPITSEQEWAYTQLGSGTYEGYTGLLGFNYPVGSLAIPEEIAIQDCYGPHAMRECIDTLVSKLDVYSDTGLVETMGVSLNDPCVSAAAFYGMNLKHGDVLDVLEPGSSDWHKMRTAAFISHSEFDLIKWTEQNISGMNFSYC